MTTNLGKQYGEIGSGNCGARVELPGNTPSGCLIVSMGECGLSDVICAECENAQSEDTPGLHVRG